MGDSVAEQGFRSALIGAIHDNSLVNLRSALAQAKSWYDSPTGTGFRLRDEGLSYRIEFASMLSADLAEAEKLISKGKKINDERFTDLRSLFQATIEIIEAEVERFDFVFGLGLVSAFSVFPKKFPVREYIDATDRFSNILVDLKTRLERARSLYRQAWADKAIDGVGLVTELIPHVRVLKGFISLADTKFFRGASHVIAAAKGAQAGIGLVADRNLGPQGPDANKIARTTASTFSDQISENVSKIIGFSKAVDGIGKVLGGVNAVFDVADFGEIDFAKEMMKDVEKQIVKLKLIYQKEILKIEENWQARLVVYMAELDKSKNRLLLVETALYDQRREYDDERRAANYISPTRWEVVG